MLKLESVSKRFSAGNYGIKDFSLELRGGVLGLLGPNGAGKTTLMQMIATITRPTQGKITFRDTDIVANPGFLRRTLGYLPQDFGVYENLTATEYLRYFASLKDVREKETLRQMLDLVNLHAVADRPVGSFSGGMKQRLGIAQALINKPDLLIVDEPTAGLDPEERVRFRNILSEIGFGKTVILSTHLVSDIESIATEIAMIRNGHLLVFGSPETLLRQTEGKVWKAVLTSDELEQHRHSLRISHAVRKPDGVHVRIVHPEKPIAGAEPAEPDLEDAYLYCMNYV